MKTLQRIVPHFPKIFIREEMCSGCGACIPVCLLQAITLEGFGVPIIDQNKCSLCESCVAACPRGAVNIDNKNQTGR